MAISPDVGLNFRKTTGYLRRPVRARKEALRIWVALYFAFELASAAPVFADVPQELVSQVVGVVGSGALLSLILRPVDGQPPRVVSRGDVYADGWVLTDLTPSVATLTKGGESRSVGLNPSGALEQENSGAPSQVEVILSAADLSLIDAEISSGEWDGKPFKGRTLEQTRRSVLYTAKLGAASQAKLKATGNGGLNSDQMRAVLGEAAYADMLAATAAGPSLRQVAIDSGDVNQVRVLDGLPPIGPDQIYIPAGTSREQAAKAAGLASLAGYTRGVSDASGGLTVTKVPGPPSASAN